MRRVALVLLLLMASCASPPSREETRPIVIAHRGASGERPEHTLAAYQLAIEQGADFIEVDVVATRDGVLVARHESELSRTTDIARRPAFADRRCSKQFGAYAVSGWFSEDLDWSEIQQLRAIERMPDIRPGSARHDGRYPIPSLAEIIELLRDARTPEGRPVGLYVEIKHATWFAHQGTRASGEPIATSLPALLVDTLVATGFTDPARIYIESFEVEPLLRLARDLMPRAGLDLPLVQLLGHMGGADEPFSAPPDLRHHAGDAPYPGLAQCLGGIDASTGYAVLASERGLRCMRRHYARGIAPRKEVVLPRDEDRQLLGTFAPFVTRALGEGLLVHVYTLRAETAFQSRSPDGTPLTHADEIEMLLDLGIDGFFTDHPKSAVAARNTFLRNRDGGNARVVTGRHP